jgi:hypothetical protein
MPLASTVRGVSLHLPIKKGHPLSLRWLDGIREELEGLQSLSFDPTKSGPFLVEVIVVYFEHKPTKETKHMDQSDKDQPLNIKIPISLIHKLEQKKVDLRVHTNKNISRKELVIVLLEHGLEHYELTDIAHDVSLLRLLEKMEDESNV